MYLKNLTYFVQLSTRKDDFCSVKSNLRKILFRYWGIGVGVKVRLGSRSRILTFRLRNPGYNYGDGLG